MIKIKLIRSRIASDRFTIDTITGAVSVFAGQYEFGVHDNLTKEDVEALVRNAHYRVTVSRE